MSDLSATAPDPFESVDSWREVRPPNDKHPFDVDPTSLGRTGFAVAYQRFEEALEPRGNEEFKTSRPDVLKWITAQATFAVYEALEWTHSLHDTLRSTSGNGYDEDVWPSQRDPELGPLVEGALGARNAIHHGLRRVVGYIVQPLPLVDGVAPHPATVRHLRWVEEVPIPTRDGKPVQRGKDARRFADAFNDHVRGLDVRNTLRAINAYFARAIDGTVPSEDAFVSYKDTAPLPINFDFLYVDNPSDLHRNPSRRSTPRPGRGRGHRSTQRRRRLPQ